jgi:hypothetical protein
MPIQVTEKMHINHQMEMQATFLTKEGIPLVPWGKFWFRRQLGQEFLLQMMSEMLSLFATARIVESN